MRRFLLLLPLLAPSASFAQHSLLRDALYLDSYIPLPGPEDSVMTYIYRSETDPVCELLASYVSPGYALSPAQLDSLFQDNPFLRLRGEIDTVKSADEGLASSATAVTSPSQSLDPISPVPSLTNLAWGLSEFLAERTKEEMNIAFFYRLKKFLEEQEDACLLFPETLEDLEAIDAQIYDFSKYLQSLRLSFYQDLDRLPEGLLRFLERHKAGYADRELFAMVLQAAVYQAEGRHPLELLHALAAQPAEAPELQGLAQAVRLLDIGVYDSFWEGSGRGFLSGERMRRLAEDGVFRLYLALLYERLKARGLQISGRPASEALRARKSDLLRLKMALLGMVRGIEDVERAWEELQNHEVSMQEGSESAKLILSADAAAGFAGLMHSAADFLRLLGTEAPLVEALGQTLSGVNELMLSVEARDYGSAVLEAASLLEPLCADSQRICIFLEKFLHYGSFMAAAVEAESASEVASLIEQYALPAGSASLKKHARLSVSVNAYVGGFYGYERLPQLAGGTSGYAPAPIYGITAPLGLNLNLGLRNYGSLSLHGSLVDVGAITSFLLQTGATTASLSQPLPELRLENLLAPGLALVYGLPGHIPLSVGLAYQRGPQLRGVRADPAALAYDLVSSRGRMMGFVAVDIPLFHLYTSSGHFRAGRGE